MTGAFLRIIRMSSILCTPSSQFLWWLVNTEGQDVPKHFFQQGLQLNTVGDTDLLETVMKAWVELVFNRKLCVFFSLRDLVSAYRIVSLPNSMAANVHYYFAPNVCPPNSSDLNLFDYYMSSLCERETKQRCLTKTESHRYQCNSEYQCRPCDACMSIILVLHWSHHCGRKRLSWINM